MTSQDPNAAASTDSSTSDAPEERKPFVEPELRCETDLVGGTAERDFFGTSTAS